MESGHSLGREGRISLPERDAMSEAQRGVYDAMVSGPRGRIIGPLRAVIHSPKLAERWAQFGEVLRFGTSLPKDLKELAILVTARRWSSQVEWWVHAKSAQEAGLPLEAIEAIRKAEPPRLPAPAAEIYEFACQLQQKGEVALPVYQAVVARWGEIGAVELAAVIGYYTMVSMTLNVHEIPVPDEATPPLDRLGDAGSSLVILPDATPSSDRSVA